jgi:diacylglycerol kinase family enzyme
VRRAALIVNPYSTAVTRDRVLEVEAALRERVDVAVHETNGPGHAVELAAEAAREADAVVVFSGDGTYNEAINGAAGLVPFGFLPGGGTSVVPRALGLPRDAVAAARQVADALAAERTRTIALGRVNGRRFCFSAGIGLDAEVVRRVDERGRGADGKRPGNLTYVATLLGVLLDRRARVPEQLEVVGFGRAAFLLVANGRPYTYAGPLAVVLSRDARFEDGLDFVAARELTPLEVPILVWRAFRGTVPGDASVLAAHDVDRVEVRCDAPLPLQADGEDLGDVREAVFEAERDALSVLL